MPTLNIMPAKPPTAFDQNELASGLLKAYSTIASTSKDPATQALYKKKNMDLWNQLQKTGLFGTGLKSGISGGAFDWNALKGAAQTGSTLAGTTPLEKAVKALGASTQAEIPTLAKLMGIDPATGLPPVPGQAKASTVADAVGGLSAIGGKAPNVPAASLSTLFQYPGGDPTGSIAAFITQYGIKDSASFWSIASGTATSQNTIDVLGKIQSATEYNANLQYNTLMGVLGSQAEASRAAVNAQYKTLGAAYVKNAKDAKFMATNDWTARGLAFAGMLNKAEADIAGEYQVKIDQMDADHNAALVKITTDMITATANIGLDKMNSDLASYSKYALSVAGIMDDQNRTLISNLQSAIEKGQTADATAATVAAKPWSSVEPTKIVNNTMLDPKTRGTALLEVQINTTSSAWMGNDDSFITMLKGGYVGVLGKAKTSTAAAVAPITSADFASLGADAKDRLLGQLYAISPAKALMAKIIWEAANQTVKVTPFQRAYDFFSEPKNSQYLSLQGDVYTLIGKYSGLNAGNSVGATAAPNVLSKIGDVANTILHPGTWFGGGN